MRRSHPVVPSAAEVADIAFQMFWSAMAPLREAGKLEMVAFQQDKRAIFAAASQARRAEITCADYSHGSTLNLHREIRGRATWCVAGKRQRPLLSVIIESYS